MVRCKPFVARESPAQRLSPLNAQDQQELSAYDDPEMLQELATRREFAPSNTGWEISLEVSGVTCAACAWLIESHFSKLPGVEKIALNMTTQKATVCWQEDKTSLSYLLEQFIQIGYRASPVLSGDFEASVARENKLALTRLAVAGLGSMQVMMFAVGLYLGEFQSMVWLQRDFLRFTSLVVTLPVVLYAALPFFTRAYYGVRTLRLGMDVPVSLAILLAFFASVVNTFSQEAHVYYDTVCMFVFFLTLSRYFERRSRQRATSHFSALHQMLPKMALQQTSDPQGVQLKSVPVKKLTAGDKVLIKAGEVIPVDGCVLSGQCAVNESLLTGESVPVQKKANASVLAGSVAGDGELLVEVSHVGREAFLHQVSSLIESSLDEKPKISTVTDQIARGFTVAVLVIAAMVYGIWHWQQSPLALSYTLAVLVVACPCALSLATPTALTVATHALARVGIVIRAQRFLRLLPKCSTVFFDKTGTLTLGKFSRVDEVCAKHGRTCQQCLPLALTMAKQLEQVSSHPISRAFVSEGEATPPLGEQDEVKAVVGAGVQGLLAGERYRLGKLAFVEQLWPDSTQILEPPTREGGWSLLGSEQAGPMVWYRVADSVNPKAAETVQQLQREGLRVEVVSGDSELAVQALAQTLRVDGFVAEVSPQEKLSYSQKAQQKGERLLWVGDGVNDAPALAAADVSLSTHSGIELAKASADGSLLHDDLTVIVKARQAAKWTERIIRQNLFWSACYNFSSIPLAAMGYLPPYLAAIGMSFSSLFVVLNSMRLRCIAE